jgi:CelD/BcsL family acetyltransferase involved in cellulose biosynthesis
VNYETLSSRAAFAQYATQWDDLVRLKPRPSPFMLHGLLDAWWEHHGAEREMRIEIATEGGRLIGGVALEVERRRGLRITHFMGRHHAALADVLLTSDAPIEVAPELARRIGRAGGDYVDLFGLPGGSTLAGVLPQPSTSFVRVEAPIVDISAGWETVYRAKTSSKRRNLHKRRRRQLEEVGDVSITIARSTNELIPALEASFRLHDLRWNGRPDGSEFTTPIGREFNRAAVAALGDAGIARILLLELDGKPIAFQYYFLFARGMYVHRLAFDPALARFSPGQVAILAAIGSAAEEGVTHVEFLGGNERYKLELADGNDPMHQVICWPRGIRGALGSKVAACSISARLRLKRSESLHKLYVDRLAPLRRALRSRNA